jgi:hypothetical protein
MFGPYKIISGLCDYSHPINAKANYCGWDICVSFITKQAF